MQADLIDQSWDPGNMSSICKAWGTTGFVCDTTKIDRELTSWGDFLDAAQKEARGQVSVVDDPKEVVGIPLFAAGHDVNTTDTKLLDEAEKVLGGVTCGPRMGVGLVADPHAAAAGEARAQRQGVRLYPGGGAMSQSSAILLQARNGDARQGILAEEGDRWKWVFPTDGASIWMDNWAIAKGAKNIDAAYAFIDYVLRPEVSLAELSYNGYHTGVKDIQDSAEKEGFERLDPVFMTDEQLRRLTAMTVNEAQQRIVDIFSAMKAKAGA